MKIEGGLFLHFRHQRIRLILVVLRFKVRFAHFLKFVFMLTNASFISAALLTYQIRNLWNHLTTFKRDVGNRRGLLKLVHQRAKILRYLKKTDQDRYEAILPRLALEPKSVEGELVI